MTKAYRDIVLGALFLLVVLVFTFFIFIDGPFEPLKQYLGENKIVTGAVFALLVFLATVVAPVAALPLAPAVSVFIGPFATGVISIIAWGLGAVVAFLIARYLGRPVLERFVDLKYIDRFERHIPERDKFVWLILLRVLVPVDIPSYAVGLLSKMRLRVYTLATFIGITPFSFIWAYGGNAFIEKNYGTLLVFSIFGLVVFILTLLLYKNRMKK
ncbi:MAG: TVP38/TMEM64 family protein [Parcubacteria group bacterium]|nr:TVP38/TMEM64 family protein [Parcubacteria group bacterium]